MSDSQLWYIDLIRHGEPEGGKMFRGHKDDPLSATGWEQLKAATAGGQWQRIVSSPLIRCQAFARWLADNRQIPCLIEEGFKEIRFGEWEGRHPAEVHQTAPNELANFWRDPVNHPAPGGETITEFVQRIGQAWEQLLATAPAENTLLVCHGGVIRAVLSHILGIPAQHFWKIDVEYASITRLEIFRDHHGCFTRLIQHGLPVHDE